MSLGINFHKTMGSFDRIEVTGHSHDDWLRIKMHVGNDVREIEIVLRSTEAVRDLRYALDAYLAALARSKP